MRARAPAPRRAPPGGGRPDRAGCRRCRGARVPAPGCARSPRRGGQPSRRRRRASFRLRENSCPDGPPAGCGGRPTTASWCSCVVLRRRAARTVSSRDWAAKASVSRRHRARRHATPALDAVVLLVVTRHPMTFARYPSLQGKSVIVTGGASGIGEATVRAFAEQASRVGFVDLDAQRGAALAAELQAAGQSAQFARCDLREVSELQSAFATLANANGPASVLVNNAARDDRHR